MKDYLTQAPMFTALELGEDLFMYLSVFDHDVSAVLLRDQGVQQPMYYISKTLVNAKTSTFGEAGVSFSACYEEVVTLFSGSYCIGLD